MNALTTPGTSPQVVDMLETAQEDIELYRQQLGMDETSVHDRYEQLKKELLTAILQMKDMVKENKALAHDIADALREKLAAVEYQVQAHAPKLTEAEVLGQLNRIRKVMDELVKYLGTLSFYDFSLAAIQDRIYRYKIKFAILRLKFKLGALEMKDTVLDLRHETRRKIHNIRERAGFTEENLSKRWGVFRHEIHEAYEHLQKAFTSN